jgi:23S rRNA A2030 N6-methylase RlmJ
MFVVNPPFTLREQLKAAMGEMLGRMGQFPGAQGVLEDLELGLIR